MIEWNVTRDLTYFNSYQDILNVAATQNNSVSQTFGHTIEYGPVSSTSIVASSGFDAGYTSYVESGFSSSSYSVSPEGYSGSNTWQVTMNVGTTSTYTSNVTQNTTTTYSAYSTAYTSASSTSSNTALSSIFSRTYFTTSTASNTGTTSGGSTTFVNTYTSVVDSGTVITLTAPIEIGTVVKADINEWLFSYTVSPSDSQTFDSNFYFITDVADSFTQETFWPVVNQSIVPYGTNTDSAGINFTVTESTYGVTFNIINGGGGDYVSTITLTVTGNDYGPYFPASTTTITAPVASYTSTASSTFGVPSSTGNAAATMLTSYTANISTTYSQFILVTGSEYFTDAIYYGQSFTYTVYYESNTLTTNVTYHNTYSSNQFTTTISGLTNIETSYAYTIANPNNYVPNATGSAAFFGTIYTSYTTNQTLASTSFVTLGVGANVLTADAITVYEPVPAIGGLQLPSAMQITDPIGTNITLAGNIYYPFVSSVAENINVIVPYNGTYLEIKSDTTFYSPTATATWAYSWSDNTLSWTNRSSTTTASGTSTITTYSTSSGSDVLSLTGNNTGTYWQTPITNTLFTQFTNGYNAGIVVFGGYSPVSTAAQLIGIGQCGVKYTQYDTNGGSTTGTTIRTALEATTSLGTTAQVETCLPVFQTVTYSNIYAGNIALPIVSFIRNNQ